ncbi:hypothetical protein [Mycoplasma hafezii]|uniref:hypothetical protein n=1 Tax=Mycoplasma hafezii TaxID=525886 RepID=UPI003CF4557D
MKRKYKFLLTSTLTVGIMPAVALVSAENTSSDEFNPPSVKQALNDIQRLLQAYYETNIFNFVTTNNLSNYFGSLDDLDAIKRDWPILQQWANYLVELNTYSNNVNTLISSVRYQKATIAQQNNVKDAIKKINEIIEGYAGETAYFPVTLFNISFKEYVDAQIGELLPVINQYQAAVNALPRVYKDEGIEALQKWKVLNNAEKSSYINQLEQLPDNATNEQVSAILQNALNSAKDDFISNLNNNQEFTFNNQKILNNLGDKAKAYFTNQINSAQYQLASNYLDSNLANELSSVISKVNVFNNYVSKINNLSNLNQGQKEYQINLLKSFATEPEWES